MAKKRKQKELSAEGSQVLARNRKALHDYEIQERYEAGIQLVGSEVKSLRDARASLGEGFVEIRRGEAWLVGVQIEEYPWANQFNHEPTRRRKLLLHKREIDKLWVAVSQRGLSLVPLAMYVKNGRIKVELGLGPGRKKFEKREAKREAEASREIQQALRRR